ncbi:hypothetical protein HYN48_03110 [Flavobacterium magnum]|uniref:Uncharacterized protein n=1 Tax=Flavobacterium magnum TaxID=2162713 RepID=A0A2S0RD23_9FLAO|nr:hypothetical protein HYN48_03110 [Flavobacterium magnum]
MNYEAVKFWRENSNFLHKNKIPEGLIIFYGRLRLFGARAGADAGFFSGTLNRHGTAPVMEAASFFILKGVERCQYKKDTADSPARRGRHQNKIILTRNLC